jgi:hypothetical protein
MHHEMRDISGDLKERADLLRGEIDSAQARFQAVITELKKERATQRQRLETELQAVYRLINIVTVQHAFRNALKSAVAALTPLGAEVSGTEGKKEKGESTHTQSVERSQEARPEASSVGRTVQKVLSKENGQATT